MSETQIASGPTTASKSHRRGHSHGRTYSDPFLDIKDGIGFPREDQSSEGGEDSGSFWPQALFESFVLTPLTMISFILSLSVVDYGQRQWRTAQHGSHPDSLWMRLFHQQPEPYQSSVDATWNHQPDAMPTPRSPEANQGWFRQKKHRAMARLEITDAFDMNGRMMIVVNCGDVLTKKKLDGHRNQCRGASFTCLDCMVHFRGTEYRSHTSCISEAQKYQGHLYRPEKDKSNGKNKLQNKKPNGSLRDMKPPGAYFEDVPDEGEPTNAIAVIDVPPKAPTPPPSNGLNVFDFLVEEATPSASKKIKPNAEVKRIEQPSSKPADTRKHVQHSQEENGQYLAEGFSYGEGSIAPSFERYESWHNLNEPPKPPPRIDPGYTTKIVMPPVEFMTPAPKHDKKDKSEKKRKRHVEDLDLSTTKRPSSRDAMMSDAPATVGAGRVLHSGLTGGLTKLLTTPGDFERDRIDAGPTPISPAKRSKREKEFRDERRKSSYASQDAKSAFTATSSRYSRDDADGKHSRDRHEQRYHDDKYSRRQRQRDSPSSDETYPTAVPSRRSKLIEYPGRAGSVQPSDANRLARQTSHAELFMSFITKGPESESGMSINKVLKRFHRERNASSQDKEELDKELWKNLRLRRNERGEIVLFL
ncbi:hypothetical protein K431DRAFT_299832 [Polychaeton citri CBS 116435]|uniref:Zinc finger C2H2 LYAR-type domain-containing protein n=1 Tax=Polychaeton citri CBS 116435 TaxID=1314669 RepID=A0A9P4QFI7_9PEZI|nr:hypothetical protein K431DRAFT_299832 [Polychaeton citri CBS 116435]